MLTWGGPPSRRLGLLTGWLEPVFKASEEYLYGEPQRVRAVRHRRRPDPGQRRRGHPRARRRHLAVRRLPRPRAPGHASTGSSPANGATRFLYRASLNKWWFDELNDLLFIRIGGRVAAFLWWFDRTIVDGTVNGVGSLTRDAGGGLRRIQTGRVQNYALGIAIGLIVMAGSFLLIVGQPR